jgi:site-specific DNA-methyltransferase (adenine-specific)
MKAKFKVLSGDAATVLKTLDDSSIHCCVTSPPYFGQRDYGVSGQIGLEPSINKYVDNLVNVFREVRRVLREDGTFWLNLGDTYYNYRTSSRKKQSWHDADNCQADSRGKKLSGLKPKDLVGLPWTVAFALREDGWWLRQECIWQKPNPMPGSMSDRNTLAHEQIFMLTKNKDYFYDKYATGEEVDYGFGKGIKNKLSVWKIVPARYRGAHFATFPVQLPETCLLSGSPTGYCQECKKNVLRNVVKKRIPTRPGTDIKNTGDPMVDGNKDANRHVSIIIKNDFNRQCDCTCDTVPSLVLDPFSGAGTTGIAAMKNGREYIGVELNPEYVKLSIERLNEYRRSFKHV